MERVKEILVVGLICLTGYLILSYKLSEHPPGIYVDEATTGYNAYSILKTGRDEYGKYFPIAFRFFGSYSPPLYVYLTTVPVYLFGLNEFSVRIISVVLASLMTLIIYGFLRLSGWFDKKIIPWLLLLFIITPWNFFYARTGYEIYLGFFLFSLGSLLLWLGIKRNSFIPLGMVVLSLSTYGSHQQIYAAPLFLFLYCALFFKKIEKRFLIAGFILAGLLQIPHFLLLGSKALISKNDLFYSKEIAINAAKIFLPPFLAWPLSFLFSFLARLTAYFSPGNLFFLPDPQAQRSVPEISVFYNWMVLPYLAGLFVLASKFKDNFGKFLLLLIVTAVLPASLTGDPFSTQRALGLLMPLFLVIALGIQLLAQKIGYIKLVFLYPVLIFYSGLLLWRSYFVLLPAERAVNWSYGYKELAKIVSENPDKTFVIDQGGDKPSYIEFAFFLKTDPAVLQQASDPKIRQDYYNLNAFNPEYKFANLDIRKVVWENDIYKRQVLVGNELLVSESQARDHFLTQMFLIKEHRDYPVFKGFATDPQKKCRETGFTSIFCKSPDLNKIRQ